MKETSQLCDFDFSLEEELLRKKKKKKAEELERISSSDMFDPEAVTFLGPDGPVLTYEVPGRGIQYAIPHEDHPIWVEWELLIESRKRLGANVVAHTVKVA